MDTGRCGLLTARFEGLGSLLSPLQFFPGADLHLTDRFHPAISRTNPTGVIRFAFASHESELTRSYSCYTTPT